MRQIWITKAGPPEVLQVRDAPDPEPKSGEVRIRVEASGVNFADILGRLGLYPDLPPIPVVPGYEVSGCIDAVGAGVDASWIGRDAFALTRFGGYADAVCVPQGQVFERPTGMSALDAAAIPVNYFTAWQLVVIMGEDALAAVQELDIPLRRELEPVLGTIQSLTPVIDALYVPNIDDALDEDGAKRHFWAAEIKADYVRIAAARLAALTEEPADPGSASLI